MAGPVRDDLQPAGGERPEDERRSGGEDLQQGNPDLERSADRGGQSGAQAAQLADSRGHRSDGSGTTYIFTSYLSAVSKDWSDKVGKGTAIDWPAGIGGKGNDGVAAAVKNTEGGFGYVEFAYAKKNNLPFASQINKAGKEMKPTVENIVNAASTSLTTFPPDMKVSIVDASGDKSYPICGFTYLLVYDDLSYMKDKALATQTLQFIMWCETDGQKWPPIWAIRDCPTKRPARQVVAKLKSIKFDGDSLLK